MKKKKLLFAIMTMASLACHAVVDGRYGKAELSATTDGGVVTEIAFFTPEIVNVRHFKTEATATKRNLVVTLDKQDVAVSVSDEGADAVVLTSSAMSVRYEKSTGCVAFFDLGGNQLLTEKSGQNVLTARLLDRCRRRRRRRHEGSRYADHSSLRAQRQHRAHSPARTVGHG